MRLPASFRTPDVVKALIPKGEKLRAWATGLPRLDGEETLVVATDVALHAPGYVAALAWERVIRASWGEQILEVVFQEEDATRIIRIALDQPGSLPQVLHERVSSTIVMRQHVALVGKRGAQLVARRVRGSDEIRWSVVFDAGLNPQDPDLRRRADWALRDLRDSVWI